MNEKQQKLLSSLEKTELKKEKILLTIEKHFKQLEKKNSVINKFGYEVDYTTLNFNHELISSFNEEIEHIDNLKWKDGQSVKEHFEICEVTDKLTAIHECNLKLQEVEKTINNWKEKIKKENIIKEEVFSTPAALVIFINHWGELTKEWLYRNTQFTETQVEQMVQEEKEIKLYQLNCKVKEAVGEVTDAKDLSVSQSGDINGIVKGKNGIADVRTITAGGYNVQRFHFRTLINKLS